ncbi:ahpC/TSA antioxidant enzyme domain-containing protein [Ditylenchus destructor]|nr:ahpC/TSA antioxidant enzyme domain-containing protein [Ditylenchus destructor]
MFAAYFGYGAVSAVLGAVFYANMPTRYTIGAVVPTVQYLSEATLKKISSEKDVLSAKDIKASEIFKKSPTLVMAVRRPGCAFCREQAAEISNVSDKLAARGVQLIGVVHEAHGVDQFLPYLKGDVYFDQEKRFYGPKERWLPLWMGFLRMSTYLNYYNTSKNGFKGNTEGEGRLLGGVYLINKNEMVFAHLEEEWGSKVDINALLQSLEKIK